MIHEVIVTADATPALTGLSKVDWPPANAPGVYSKQRQLTVARTLQSEPGNLAGVVEMENTSRNPGTGRKAGVDPRYFNRT